MDQPKTSITVYRDDNSFLAPAVGITGALMRYKAMTDFVNGALRSSTDYGEIPGTNKPTLLKPGAEKLCSFFGLSPRFEIIEKELDWTGSNHNDEPFFYFHYRCILVRGDRNIAEGEGSASSWEKKYRYRSADRVCPNCGKPTIIKGKAEFGGGWICFAKKGGCGAKFAEKDSTIINQPTGQVKNPDVADYVNTIQKMAQKRAYVGAVLLATNASEFFTQDMEDFVDGNYEVVPTEQVTHSAPAHIHTPEQEPTTPPAPKSWTSTTVSLETAQSEKSSDGTTYWDMETSQLAIRANSLSKTLAKNNLADDEKSERELKLAVIQAILAYRA